MHGFVFIYSGLVIMTVKRKIFAYLLLPIFILLGLIQLYNFRENKSNRVNQIRYRLLDNSQIYANRIDSMLSQVSSIAVTTAQFLSVDDSFSEKTLYEVLRRNVNSNPLIYGACIAFEPGVFQGRRLFGPYAYRSGNDIRTLDVATQSYDYTAPEWEWYNAPRKLSASIWTEPFFDRGAGNIIMVTFSVPFYRYGRFAGVATVDLDLSHILELAGIDNHNHADLYILSKRGNFIYPQSSDHLIKSLQDGAAGFSKDQALRLQPLLAESLKGKSGQFIEFAGSGSKTMWASLAPIKTADWNFLEQIDPEEALMEMNNLDYLTILLIFMTLVLGGLIAWLLVGRIINPISRLSMATKEIMRGNLSVSVKPEEDDEIGHLAGSFSEMAKRLAEREQALIQLNDALETRVEEQTRELQIERDKLRLKNLKLEYDISLAREIQYSLIPQKAPADYIATLYKPMQAVGGDFFDFITFADSEKIGIFISDVSGHGVSAAFITAMIKTMVLQSGSRLENPAMLLLHLNEILQNQTAGNFITIFYGIFDPVNRSFVYSNAGQNAPYLILQNEITQLNQKSGPPVAVVPNYHLHHINKTYVNSKVNLLSGGKLVLYTDGLTEATGHQSDDMFEEIVFPYFLNEHRLHHPEVFLSNLYSRLVQFHGSEDFDDDICAICLDFKAGVISPAG